MRSVCLCNVYTYIGLCIYPSAIPIFHFLFASDYYVQKTFFFFLYFSIRLGNKDNFWKDTHIYTQKFTHGFSRVYECVGDFVYTNYLKDI